MRSKIPFDIQGEMKYVIGMKWKSIKTGRTVEVLGDEKVNNRPYRFYTWDDDPKQEVCQWDMIYAEPWEDNFVLLTF